MSSTPEHQDADRLARAAQGLPPDVHDADTEAAYEALQRPAAKAKASSPKPTRKGGGKAST
jgi:hypothetical protein